MRPRSGHAPAATAFDRTGGRQPRSIPARRRRANAPTLWLDRRCRPMPRRRRARETRVLPDDDARSPIVPIERPVARSLLARPPERDPNGGWNRRDEQSESHHYPPCGVREEPTGGGDCDSESDQRTVDVVHGETLTKEERASLPLEPPLKPLLQLEHAIGSCDYQQHDQHNQ